VSVSSAFSLKEGAIDELEAAVADGMKSQAQLRELKQKFGVTRYD
jgi:hypothetical protein